MASILYEIQFKLLTITKILLNYSIMFVILLSLQNIYLITSQQIFEYIKFSEYILD